jgi:hypothetical protein
MDDPVDFPHRSLVSSMRPNHDFPRTSAPSIWHDKELALRFVHLVSWDKADHRHWPYEAAIVPMTT